MQPLDAQRAAFIMFMRGVLHSSASVEQVVSDRSENHEGMGGMLRNDSPVAQVRSIGEGAASRRCRSIQAAAGQIACCPAPQALVGCCVLRAYAQRQYELSCTMPSSALLGLLPPPMCALPPVPAGKETVRRLLDLPAACSLVGVDLDLPEGLTSVTTVGELAQLLAATKEHATVRAIVCSAARVPSAAAAAVVLLEGCPGNLQPEDRRAPAAAAPSAPRCRRLPHTPTLHLVSQDLSQVLKLSKSQLETAAAHVATAVEPDTWLRVFLAPSGAGLLYSCDQGGCTLGEPAGGCCSKQGEGEAGSCAVHAAGVWLPNRRWMPRTGSSACSLHQRAHQWHWVAIQPTRFLLPYLPQPCWSAAVTMGARCCHWLCSGWAPTRLSCAGRRARCSSWWRRQRRRGTQARTRAGKCCNWEATASRWVCCAVLCCVALC